MLGLSVLTDPFCIYSYFKEIPDVPPNPNDFPEQTGWRKYISIKRDLSVYHPIEKSESVVKFHDEHFPTICDHTTNLLSSFNVFKVFQDYFSRY